MENEQLFELMTKMYGDMQGEFKKVREDMNKGFKEVNSKIDKIDNRVTIIEEDHGKKLDLLFDGYKQNADKIDRIEDISNELKEFREETSNNFTKLNHYTHDVDTKNADRHFDFVGELRDLKHSVNRIEINTAENWRDIARLKTMRKYKTK